MAEVVIPEIKHEYIRQVDTETTKNDWFDECIADNKEAAWAGIGTSENDSQYQPAPSVEPDYYMQYCSSDDYDYLKDYRLIWGYGIGIIEQDVICSLSTGEHLAEGKDACDTYSTENAAGQDTDWKRGTWIKFSGNRNISPTRIGEVTLPDRVISLKDLCAALTLENPCDFYLPQENGILNAQNLCGTKTNSPITLCLSEDAGMPFANALNLSYAFAYTDARIWQFDTYAIDESYMFYHAKVGQLVIASMDSSCNYASKFEEATGDGTTMITASCLDKAMFKNSNNLIVDTTITSICKQDVSECFYRCDIYMDITDIDFSEARNVQNMFYDINIIEDEITLDLSSFVEHDDDVEDRFNGFFNSFNDSKIINITSPNCKIKGHCVFQAGSESIFNINGLIKYYAISDLIEWYDKDNQEFVYGLFKINWNNTINGEFQGVSLFTAHNTGSGEKLTKDSNIIIHSYDEDKVEDTIKNILIFYDSSFPCICNGVSITSPTIFNLDDYYFVNALNNNSRDLNSINDNTDEYININKTNKEFFILSTNSISSYSFNITSNTNFYISQISNNNINYTSNVHSTINIINDNDYDINAYQYFRNTNRYVILNCPHGNLKFVLDSDNILDTKVSTYLYYRFISLNSLYYNDESRKYGSTRKFCLYSESLNYIYLNSRQYYHNHNDYRDVVPNYANMILTDSDNLNISSNITNNDSEDNIIIPVIYIIPITKESLNYPIITHEQGDWTCNGVHGIFKNTPITEFFKRFADKDNTFLRMVDFTLTHYDNKIETVINNAGENIINPITNRSVNNSNVGNFNYFGSLYSLIINLRHIANRINDYNINNAYITNMENVKFSSSRIQYINSNFNLYTFLSSIELNHIIANTINIYFGFYEDSYYRTIDEINFDDDCDVTNLKFIYNQKGCKINIQCNLSYLNKLTQESINSICVPTFYNSGCTLTIHTTPFQYITEEQKQALVNAGVTLVEYIPTETTE